MLAVGLVLLGAAVAGLRVEIRELQRAARRGPRGAHAVDSPKLKPSTTNLRVVLAVTAGCAACADAVRNFPAVATQAKDVADFTILAHSSFPELELAQDLDVVIDAALFDAVAPSWSPALLFVDEAGSVVDVAPADDDFGKLVGWLSDQHKPMQRSSEGSR